MMKRLTERGNGHAYYPRCFGEPCGGMGCRIKDCPFDGEICERFAAYEDTGLEPEEVLPKDKADEIALKLMRLADLESFASYDRLRELAEADKDGRVVVLPCKVGTPIYRVQWARPVEANQLEVKEGVFREPFVEKLGRNIFFTREDAEKRVEVENERLRRKDRV